MDLKKLTVRASGKAHRALQHTSGKYQGHLVISCSCPGSKNGRLANTARILCEGWEKANCGN